MKKFILFGILFGIATLALTIMNLSFAKNSDVVPSVFIRSPQDHEVVIDDTLDVEVWFFSKKGKVKVKHIRLELDGDEIATYAVKKPHHPKEDRPKKKPKIKYGTHTFHLDITDLNLGEHTLQAFAYRGKKKVKLEEKSQIVIFTKSDIPTASRIIKNPTTDPDGIFVDESTMVTITAEIISDSDLIESEIILQRLNKFHQPAEFLGYLHDDGLEGDITADDNIYTLEVNFDEPQPSEIKLRIFAEYLTSPTIISSTIFTIDAVIPISEEEFIAILEVEEEASQEFERLREFHSDDKARRLTVNWLKRQYGVEDAGISSDNATIWILFTSGLEGGVTTHPVGTKGSFSSTSTEPPAIPETTNAIVLAPFFDEFTSDGGDESDYIAEKLSQLWSPVSTIKHSAVTVDLMKTLSQYTVVSISSHGSINSKDEVQIYTGEKATPLNRLQHIFDLMAGRARVSIVNGHYMITPSFISHYGQPYPKSLIYISACSSVENNTMSNAFLDKGAYTYFGYDDIVWPDFAYSIGTRLFDYLLEDRMTTGDAFIALGDKIDPSEPHAEFLMAGGDDLVLAEKSIITDESPTGEIENKRPAIEARVYSPSNIAIDLSSVVLILDGSTVTPTITPGTDGSDITVAYTPSYDLETGEHTIVINANDIIGLTANQKTWTFELKEEEGFLEKFPEGFPIGDEGVWGVRTYRDVVVSGNPGGGVLISFGAKGLASPYGWGYTSLNLSYSEGRRLKDAILDKVSVPYSYTNAQTHANGYNSELEVAVYGWIGSPIYGEGVSRRKITIPGYSTSGSGVITWRPIEDFVAMGFMPRYITRLVIEFEGWDNVDMAMEGFHSGTIE